MLIDFQNLLVLVLSDLLWIIGRFWYCCWIIFRFEKRPININWVVEMKRFLWMNMNDCDAEESGCSGGAGGGGQPKKYLCCKLLNCVSYFWCSYSWFSVLNDYQLRKQLKECKCLSVGLSIMPIFLSDILLTFIITNQIKWNWGSTLPEYFSTYSFRDTL